MHHTEAQVRKVLDILGICRAALMAKGVEPVEFPKTETNFPKPDEALNHALWMINKMDANFIMTEWSKAQRWLGFIQAILWFTTPTSIEGLATINRNNQL